jgi:hypothetical protein
MGEHSACSFSALNFLFLNSSKSRQFDDLSLIMSVLSLHPYTLYSVLRTPSALPCCWSIALRLRA